MKAMRIIIVMCVIVAVQTVQPATLIAQSVKKQTGQIEGVVLNEEGERVAQSSITLEAEKFALKVESDMGGYFNVCVPVGGYRLTAKKDGFKILIWERLNVKHETPRKVDIRLVRSYVNPPLEVVP